MITLGKELVTTFHGFLCILDAGQAAGNFALGNARDATSAGTAFACVNVQVRHWKGGRCNHQCNWVFSHS
ncbi:hypothetical protein BGE01nite_26070 [Brevifollis gellanilyticus]|uniref:Uncharacterized protein n=1 Tax=Brevifollis gellanilyticus TaxID=748831 RepID=A0A512M9A7_9BACT|nr:hypothetical protein BGE01nite_26070 [Brevifollis gellanilyticus]